MTESELHDEVFLSSQVKNILKAIVAYGLVLSLLTAVLIWSKDFSKSSQFTDSTEQSAKK